MLKNNQINNYYFFTVGSFPFGNAATNRALSYMRGLAELDCNVTLFVFSPDKKQSKLSDQKITTYNGVNIIYTCPLLFVKGRLLYKLNLFLGIIYAYYKLFKVLIINKGQSPIFLLNSNPVSIWFFLIPIKLFGAKVFHERTEFPFLMKKNNWLFRFYINNIIPRFDGLYVISFALVNYFKNLTNKPVYHLPMTVEMDRFKLYNKNKKIKYIAYCGSMYTNKDGVPDLIEAFNIIADKYSELYLYLIGDNSDKKKFQIIKKKIEKSPVKERIITTGFIERRKIPELLGNATILALCRPKNLQALGGFPTKLGEYLATGNPVVITDVGDHTKYLKHKESAFIALPDCPADFADKINMCLSNKTLSDKVGFEGYEVACEHFNHKTQAKNLKNFVEKIY